MTQQIVCFCYGIGEHLLVGNPEIEVSGKAPPDLLDDERLRCDLLPAMLERSMKFAEEVARDEEQAALDRIHVRIGGEIRRLRYLREINDHISDDEVEAMESLLNNQVEAIRRARLRLDSLCLIFSKELCG